LEVIVSGYTNLFAKETGGESRLAGSTPVASAMVENEVKCEGKVMMLSRHKFKKDYCIMRSPSQCRSCMVAAVGANYHAGVLYEKMASRIFPNSSGVEETFSFTR